MTHKAAFASEVRSVAGVDGITKVRRLLEDKNVDPATPVTLAGARLEIALRAAGDEKQLTITEKPSISAYYTKTEINTTKTDRAAFVGTNQEVTVTTTDAVFVSVTVTAPTAGAGAGRMGYGRMVIGDYSNRVWLRTRRRACTG